jgi:hypothetical protein
MSDLPLMIERGTACTEQPGGFYYGYFHHLSGGSGLQRSQPGYIGTGLPEGTELLQYATLAFDQASRQQKLQIASISVLRLCTSSEHGAEPRRKGHGPQLERVVTVGVIKPDGERFDFDPPKRFIHKKEVGRYLLADSDRSLDNVLAASLTNDERATLPVTSIYEASPVQYVRGRQISTYIALHDLVNQITIQG